MCIRREDVTVCKVLVSLLDSIYSEYNTKILFEIYSDTSIDIQCIWTTVVSVLNYIFVSR